MHNGANHNGDTAHRGTLSEKSDTGGSAHPVIDPRDPQKVLDDIRRKLVNKESLSEYADPRCTNCWGKGHVTYVMGGQRIRKVCSCVSKRLFDKEDRHDGK